MKFLTDKKVVGLQVAMDYSHSVNEVYYRKDVVRQDKQLLVGQPLLRSDSLAERGSM